MSGSRQNVYLRGAYEGDARIQGDNGLNRAIGRSQHRRPPSGQVYMLADPSIFGNGASLQVFTGVNGATNPIVVNVAQGEQFMLMAVYDPIATQNANSFFMLRFFLNNEAITSWIQPAPLRAYQVDAAGAVLTSQYAAPISGLWTFPFDQIQFALAAGNTVTLNFQGMVATGGCRIAPVASSNV